MSLDLHAGLASELCLLFKLALDVSAERLRRSARRQLDAALKKALAQLRRAYRLVDLGVQARQRVPRCAGGGSDSVESDLLEPGHAGFVDRRQLRKHRGALETGDCERPQLAGMDIGCRRADLVVHERDVPGDDIDDRL